MANELLMRWLKQHEFDHPGQPLLLTAEQQYWLYNNVADYVEFTGQRRIEEWVSQVEPVLGVSVRRVLSEQNSSPVRELWSDEAMALLRRPALEGES